MVRSTLLFFALGFVTACTHSAPLATTEPTCPYSQQDRTSLEAWRSAQFETDTPDQATRQLATCLGAPDPFLRDQISYEGLTTVLRNGNVSPDTRRELIAELSTNLQAPDVEGFLAPFSALGLAELARTDRVDPFLTEPERTSLVETAASYLESVSDYRGFSDGEGWRHGVAHGADFAMQLTLNPNVDTQALLRLRESVTAQIAPSNGHAYVFGEPERLARPILFMASRGEIEADDWGVWFESLSDPAPLETWNEAFKSEVGLARLHNLKGFAQVLYINASLSENPNMAPIADGAMSLLSTLP